jgi:hypothetical protein
MREIKSFKIFRTSKALGVVFAIVFAILSAIETLGLFNGMVEDVCAMDCVFADCWRLHRVL